MPTTRSMVVPRPGEMELREFPLPRIGRDDALMEVELVGVCGSDPGIFYGKATRIERPYPIILGHEIVGRIKEIGPEAAARWKVEAGDRAIVEYAFGCGRCRACLTGRYTLCAEYLTYGNLIGATEPPHLFGGYGEHVYLHPRAMVHKVGDDISPEEGVLICAVLGNSVRWLTQVGRLGLGQSVAIVGPGQQGLSGVITAKAAGAGPVILVGLSEDAERLAMARRFGADLTVMADKEDPVAAVAAVTGGLMADLVMDVSGAPPGAAAALSLAGQGATLVLPGLYGATTDVPLKLDQAVFKELTIRGAYSHNFAAVEPAIRLVRDKRPPLAEMISHRFPLERAREAVDLVAGKTPGPKPLKVVIDPKS